jgi:hypothetical protein
VIGMHSAPRFWFWWHDIQPDQVAGLDMPGMRLRRLAALYYDDDGPGHL